MKLLPNEKTLITSSGDKIVLTDHRIHMTDSVLGQSFTISMFLENISSVEIKYKSNIMLLVLAVLAVIGGGVLSQQQHGPNSLFITGLIVGAVLVVVWWFTRKHMISITPDGGSSLDFIVKGMKEEQIQDFVHNVSLAKQSRVSTLHQ